MASTEGLRRSKAGYVFFLTLATLYSDFVKIDCYPQKTDHGNDYAVEEIPTVISSHSSKIVNHGLTPEDTTRPMKAPVNYTYPKNANKLTVTGYTMITSTVLQLTLAHSDKSVFKFNAGQFITFLLPHDGKLVRRSYSLANSPDQSHKLEVAIAPVKEGFATKILFNLKIGDELFYLGPQGRLILEGRNAAHYVLVATGTGVTPYRSMLPNIAKMMDKNENLNVTVLQGVRRAEDLLYPEEFITLSEKYEGFRFRAHLSREEKLNTSYQYPGYVQSAFEALHLSPATDLVYLCGNPNMVDDSINKLKTLGFTTQRIIREKYASRGV